MTLIGFASFSWVSDYTQFYLGDVQDDRFSPPDDITSEMERRRFASLPWGIAVYTNDSLNQRIEIEIFDMEPSHSPVEMMSGKVWTQVETTALTFPTGRFSLSSPSHPTPLPAGPLFFPPKADMIARVSWMEVNEGLVEDGRLVPSVIKVSMWPG